MDAQAQVFDSLANENDIVQVELLEHSTTVLNAGPGRWLDFAAPSFDACSRNFSFSRATLVWLVSRLLKRPPMAAAGAVKNEDVRALFDVDDWLPALLAQDAGTHVGPFWVLRRHVSFHPVRGTLRSPVTSAANIHASAPRRSTTLSSCVAAKRGIADADD
jgi:hypothetical protein